tara:strand:- start:4930 stop:5523 length:594 start_codon:yes stop_codon:yes gene_type:complete
MARLASGEIAIIDEGKRFTFRPSFRSLDNLHNDHDVFELWNDLQNGNKDRQLFCAQTVFEYFLTDQHVDDLTPLMGAYTQQEDDDGEIEFIWRDGNMPESEQVIIAFSLLRNAIQGKTSVKAAKKSEENHGAERELFNVMDYVWSAQKNLGLSMDESWSLTMHEFMNGMKNHHPDSFIDYEEEDAKVEALLKRTGKA